MDTTAVGIFVDYDLYATDELVRSYVYEHQDHAKIVFLVSNPHIRDYDLFDDGNHIVIRNTGHKSDIDFKRHSVDVIKDVTNLVPIVGIDMNSQVRAMYEGSGFYRLLPTEIVRLF